MVDYGSIWSTNNIFCQRCHRQKKGISLKNKKMSEFGLSLDLCPSCISEIALETEDF
ncbi:MAG: hypothetical protein AABX85_01690 [Nanoarchaeota archaeon]